MSRGLTKKQVLALITAFCLIALLLLSTLFVVAHARHDCSGSRCEICREIAFFLTAVQHLTVPVAILHMAAGLLALLLFSTPTGIVLGRRPETLVLLKVRLDN